MLVKGQDERNTVAYTGPSVYYPSSRMQVGYLVNGEGTIVGSNIKGSECRYTVRIGAGSLS